MQSNANVSLGIVEENWHSIDWCKVNSNIRNLRRRIFKATKEGNIKKLSSLQKLMLKSYSNVLISVRKVTQINQGKNTAGADKLLVKTPKARWELSQLLAKGIDRNVSPTKRVQIPKKNGKTRPLGIPTIKDRVIQNIVKNALEPCWEAKFEGISYGFRPGRSVHDALGKTYLLSCPHRTKRWVVDADISGCFDNISHEKLLEIIGNFPKRKIIAKWLKAGYIDRNTFHPQEKGTPQGSIISPLLANIALHGMEKALGIKYNCRGEIQGNRAIVRYADDFVIFCSTKEDAIKSKETINRWLNERGLGISEEKTKIVHLTEGFNFLSMNVRLYKVKNTKTGLKLLIKPSKEFERKCRQDLKEIFLKYVGQKIDVLLSKINPVIRGKANYMNKYASSKTFRKLDKYLFLRQCRYTTRTHPTKSKKWKQNKYWGKLSFKHPNYNWAFGNKQNGFHMLAFSWFNIERHIMVSKTNSPDDPNLIEYWEKRKVRQNKSDAEKLNTMSQKIAKKQNYTCPICNQSIFNGEETQIHHVIPRNQGGSNRTNNLVHLHIYCHHKTHHDKNSTMNLM